MKRISKILTVLMSVALLSSCTESKVNLNKEPSNWYTYQGHGYLKFGLGSGNTILHDPKCQESDMITLLDSLQKAK